MPPQGLRLLLALVAAGRGARALRMHRMHEPPPLPLADKQAKEGDRSLRGPPDLTLFESDWSNMTKAERRGHEAMTEEVQLVLGVFTVGAEQQHRKVVRRTWMSQTGVCDLLAGQRTGCSVYVAFVMGSRDQEEVNEQLPYAEYAAHIEGDPTKEDRMLVVNASDFMNDGKTPEFFRHVSERYPWATHVAKCDIDAYPAIRKLVASIHVHSQSAGTPYSYAGECWACPPGGCEGMMDFSENAPYLCAETPRAWFPARRPDMRIFAFHHGPLYLMSMPLVREIAVRGGAWEDPPHRNHEDIIAGNAVHAFFNKTWSRPGSPCLDVWNPLAYCHRELCTISQTFDDF